MLTKATSRRKGLVAHDYRLQSILAGHSSGGLSELVTLHLLSTMGSNGLVCAHSANFLISFLSSLNIPRSQPDLDFLLLRLFSQVILDCGKSTVKTNQHNRPSRGNSENQRKGMYLM